MILHPIIDLLKRIVVALPDYAGGGGEDLLEQRISNTLTEYRNEEKISIIRYGMGFVTSLENLFLPNASLDAAQTIQGCTKLETAIIYQIKGNYSFSDCSKLNIVDITNKTENSSITTYSFNSCSSFKNLIIRLETAVASLTGIQAFQNTPFASGGTGGTIYIPKALYDHLGDGTALDYKSATNWSTIDGYGTITWAQIEGSYYETHYADGTVIS